jgi:1,4-dihydroxy-2-naphthoyl-CoA synthase
MNGIGRFARITLNRPEVLNAIDAEVPRELEAAVERAQRIGSVPHSAADAETDAQWDAHTSVCSRRR